MQHCNFGTALEDMIRDCFVCGINGGVIQRQLLAMKYLKLADALPTALLIEAADRNTQELQSSQDATVHAVARGEEDCRTSQQHVMAVVASTARNNELICHSCKKRGYIAWAYWNTGQSGRNTAMQLRGKCSGSR